MFAGPWYAFEVSSEWQNCSFVCSGADRDEVESKAKKKAEENPGKLYLVLKLCAYARAGVPPVEFLRMNEDGNPVVGLDKVIVPDSIVKSARSHHELPDPNAVNDMPGLGEALASRVEGAVGKAVKAGRFP